ncbi:MAG: hypothetical protein JNM89_15985 [Hyphomicrobiaceae bacterium]|nr:hypothetical protein [Hyphomicrobiaceae bacterium]
MGIGDGFFDGFFLGGVQEGMSERREFEQKKAIQDAANARAKEELGLSKKKFAHARQQAEQAAKLEMKDRSEKHLSAMLADIEETTKALRQAGASQDQIEQTLAPYATKALQFGTKFGADPELLGARLGAIVSRPAAPQTDIGKLEADRRAGYIDEATYRKKLDAIGSGGITINTGEKGANKFAEELNKGIAGEFIEKRKSAIDAIASMQSTAEARKLLDAGIITGTGADYILQFGKSLQTAGVTLAPEAIANTEAFVATRAAEVGRIIKLFGAGTGLSDADREFATRAAAGSITLTEASIKRVLEINLRASRNVIKAYNADVSQLDPSILPFDLRLPEAPAAATGEAPIRKTINGVTYEKRDGTWFTVSK